MPPVKPRRHVKAKYRSGLEDQVAAFLLPIQKEVRYEKISIEWEDLMYRSYTPDFVLDNGIIIEAKGLFDSEDRRKHLAVKRQHPELDIRFIFSSAKSKLYKGSKTCYSDWCDKNGFRWANRIIPKLWLLETGTAPVTSDIKLNTPKKEKL